MSNMKVKLTIQDKANGIWMLEYMRVSYPNLWKPGLYKGAVKPGLDTSFLIPIEEMDTIKQIHSELVALGKTIDPNVKKVTQMEDPKFVKTKDGKHYVLKTTNSRDYPPVYFDRQGREQRDPLAVGADKELYAGCYCRIKLSINPVETPEGKVKLWTNLSAIQFLADGDKFGGGMNRDELAQGFGQIAGDFEGHGTSGDTGGDDLDLDDDLGDDEFDDDEFDLD